MDKYDFIKRLEAGLSGLSDEEINSAVSYYKELFEDAGNENSQELINKLGTPEKIAENIKRESGTVAVARDVKKSQSAQEQSKTAGPSQSHDKKQSECCTEKLRGGGTILLLAILAVLTSPVWLSLLIAFYAVVFAILVTVAVIVLVFGVLGIAGIISGISVLLSFPPVGLVLLGLGIIFTALTVMCTPFICKGLFRICRAVINGTVSVFHSIFYERRQAV